ncbi:MAG: hypothetical protein VKL39_23850, partial [Leptolyngbyaceae bacterium]|nr:hypothetical protein [Leptolyngbyaceae bacterium]
MNPLGWVIHRKPLGQFTPSQIQESEWQEQALSSKKRVPQNKAIAPCLGQMIQARLLTHPLIASSGIGTSDVQFSQPIQRLYRWASPALKFLSFDADTSSEVTTLQAKLASFSNVTDVARDTTVESWSDEDFTADSVDLVDLSVQNTYRPLPQRLQQDFSRSPEPAVPNHTLRQQQADTGAENTERRRQSRHNAVQSDSLSAPESAVNPPIQNTTSEIGRSPSNDSDLQRFEETESAFADDPKQLPKVGTTAHDRFDATFPHIYLSVKSDESPPEFLQLTPTTDLPPFPFSEVTLPQSDSPSLHLSSADSFLPFPGLPTP